MSGDKLVFDLANEVEDVPNVFVRKDWISILDNQNSNYNSNQSVIDTSQLCNSNKYISYREGYLGIPLLLTMSSTGTGMIPAQAAAAGNAAGSVAVDFAVGLKNWFGQIVHSLTLDFNGTTVIQQTPFINMWNSFKLMTSLSWADVTAIGSSIGFYPDDALSWSYQGANSVAGKGVCNNTNMAPPLNLFGVRSGQSFPADLTVSPPTDGVNYSTYNSYKSGLGNEGFLRRQLYIMYDADATNGNSTFEATSLTGASANSLWKSRIITKVNGAPAIFQVAINATVYLRHLHSFFNQIPLIKGAFMKLTLNLNNTTVSTTVAAGLYTAITVQNAVGGVNPIMLSSRAAIPIGGNARVTGPVDGFCSTTYNNGGVSLGNDDYVINLSVGARCLNSAQSNLAGVITSPLSQSINLYVPAYSFNSVFEQAYISSPIKKVIYEDVYQYQITGIGAGNGQINSLLTNGIANLRSVLLLPFYSADDAGHLVSAGIPAYQSPFDPAGTGPTSPLCMLTNFNVVVSGQNVIYNTVRYSGDLFLQQVYGCNAVNAGMTEGINSSLINQQSWEMEYCYHYVDVSRMLPVEQMVPKSVQIVGQNTSVQKIDLWCFLAYGCELQFDVVSGARV